MVSNDEFRAANERGRRLRKATSPAVSAKYDRKSRRIVVSLDSGVDLSFSPHQFEGLQNASTAELGAIEITPSGLGLYFPQLDADVYIPGLLSGAMGSRQWMAARLGALGGKSTSIVKRRASRANGRLGGRPKKLAG